MAMYRKSRYALMLFVALLLPFLAHAETIEGKMNGLRCAVEGIVCPIDKLDPMIAAESDFVIQKPDGTFYLIPNLSRQVKSRYVLQDVRITGDISEKYQAITAKKLEVKQDGEYRTVWTPELEARIWEDLVQPGATRR